ncbi:DUF5703 family protein [Cellulomonas sp. Marseille-Q8402]
MARTSLRTGRADGPDMARQYEYRVVTIPRTTSRNDARRLLTDEAEYGRWELARTLLFTGGERKVWLRRRIIRVRSTLGSLED